MDKSSRLPGFYDLSVDDRLETVARWAGLDDAERAALAGNDLTAAQADQMIENVVGLHTLPLGVAANFLVNGRDYLVPMAIEEPSVVAAASYEARKFGVKSAMPSVTPGTSKGARALTNARLVRRCASL